MHVEDTLRSIVLDILDVDEEQLTPDASFMDDLGADSVDVVGLIAKTEEAFGIHISDRDVLKIVTLQDAIDCVYACRVAQEGENDPSRTA